MALNTTDVLLGCWFKTVLNLLWEQGVGGSNPLTPTPFSSDEKPSFYDGGFLFLLLKSISYKVINLNQIKSNIPKSGTHFCGTHPMGRMGIYIGWCFTSPHQKSISMLNGFKLRLLVKVEC